MTFIPEELRPYVVPRAVPDQLIGTARQIEFASSIRRSFLAVARKYAPADIVDMMMCIRDSTWWIANRSRPLDKLKWPSPAQMRSSDPSLSMGSGFGNEGVESASSVKANRHGGDRGDREVPDGQAAFPDAPGPTRNLAGRLESVESVYTR